MTHEERIDTSTEHGHEGYENLEDKISYYEMMRDTTSGPNRERFISHAAKIVRELYGELDTQSLIMRPAKSSEVSSDKYTELLTKYNKCVEQKRLLKKQLADMTKRLEREHGRYQELAKIYDSVRKSER